MAAPPQEFDDFDELVSAPPSTPAPLSEKKLLLGEGKDEVNFFIAILKNLGITGVQVEGYGGKHKLGDYLETLAVRHGFASLVAIGVTRDADASAAAAYESALASLGRAALQRPPALGSFSEGEPRIGVYIFPGCVRAGMLEDLCLASVARDPATPCLDEFIGCIESAGCHPNNPSKARVHAWLASRLEPDKRLGEAALKRYWPWDDPAFDPLKTFLRNL